MLNILVCVKQVPDVNLVKIDPVTGSLIRAGVPAILVPYPRAAGDHQTRNAEALSETGAAILLPDAELTPDVLVQEARRILSDDVLRAKMKDKISRFRVPDSKTVILREILALCPELER